MSMWGAILAGFGFGLLIVIPVMATQGLDGSDWAELLGFMTFCCCLLLGFLWVLVELTS